MRASRWAILVLAASAGCIGGADEPVDAGTVEPGETAQAPVAAEATTNVEANATIPDRPKIDLTATSVGFYPLNPSYTMSQDEVPTGAIVTVTYRNEDLNPLGSHDWVLEGIEGAATAQVGVGEEAMARFVAPAPGAYTYYCSVEGHRERGMEGTLTIV